MKLFYKALFNGGISIVISTAKALIVSLAIVGFGCCGSLLGSPVTGWRPSTSTYRSRNAVGLTEAQNYIKTLSDQLRASQPEKFTQKAKKKMVNFSDRQKYPRDHI